MKEMISISFFNKINMSLRFAEMQCQMSYMKVELYGHVYNVYMVNGIAYLFFHFLGLTKKNVYELNSCIQYVPIQEKSEAYVGKTRWNVRH